MSANPNQAMLAAGRLQAQGRSADAERVYRQVIENHPDHHPAYHALGLLAFNVGKLEVAVELIGSAITLAEDNATYHRDRGEICRQVGQIEQAISHASRTVALAPRDESGHYNLGLALADNENPEAALASYREAVRLKPTHGLALNNMGSVLEELDQPQAAERAYRDAIAINPRHAEALGNLGALLSKLGAIHEAKTLLESALSVDPNLISTHFTLSTLKHYRADDPDLVTLEALMDQVDSVEMPQKAQLCFTVGKARDNIGDHAGAFAAYAQGNRLKQATLPSPPARGDRLLKSIRERFTRSAVAAHSGSAITDPAPVFIVGMPRSGTSLIEQILASHPSVHGAGELRDLHQIAGAVLGESDQTPFPIAPDDLTTQRLTTIANRYLESLHAHAPEALRITDKMPANFHYLGLIKLALPGAKIIHSMRDPMDSCLSCYTRLFNDTMEFAYDLTTLGRYYVRYAQMMAHWHDVMPEGFILNLRYEDLVADMPGQTRRMLDHVGLPWDDNCLEFYNTERPVRTASLAQVRQPIYKTSVGSWRRFERQLAPLLEIVRDYRD